MKILWIYNCSTSIDYDKWLHLDFVQAMKQLGVDIAAYGPHISLHYPNLVELNYSPTLTWGEILQKIKPSVVILNTKSRMFEYYSPHTKTSRGCILPSGFTESNQIPKIVIEEDYHYEEDDSWYSDVGINLILQRHYSQFLRKGKVQNKWFPFSVDTNLFKPVGSNRKNKICFAGHLTGPYTDRKILCDKLYTKGLIDIFCKKEKVGLTYIQCLQEYVSHLCSSSIYKITAAKVFEIMASGSLLMTDNFPGIELLFPEDSYCSVNIDGSDVIEKANKVLQNTEYRKHTVETGLKCINEKHSHKVRTNELLDILKEYV